MALWTRAQADELVAGLIHHSDTGSQYTSIRYTDRLTDAGAVASIGTVRDSYDNALAESVIGLYKAECIHFDGPWRNVDDVELSPRSTRWWFDTTRLHSSLGYVPPIKYEQNYYCHNNPRELEFSGQAAPPLNPGRFIVTRLDGRVCGRTRTRRSIEF